MKSLLNKSIKIAGVTCVAAGAVALVTSGTALKAISEGGKYLLKAVKKIAGGQDSPEGGNTVPEENN